MRLKLLPLLLVLAAGPALGQTVTVSPFTNPTATGSGGGGGGATECAELSDDAPSCSIDATNAANISSGTLPAARLPLPTAVTTGGVFSIAPVASNWLRSLGVDGVFTASQPACADLSNAAASCSTDATNASNIGSGTLVVARGGTGAAPGADDQALISDSTSAATWRDLPNCTDTGGNHLNYTAASNSFSCGTSGVSGDAPGGVDGTLQYRVNSTTFGGVTSSSVSGANVSLGGTLSVASAGLLLTGAITPTALGADAHDYEPTGAATASTWYISATAVRTITGIAGGAAGRILNLVNVGSNAIILYPQHGSSAAANRFATPAGGMSGVALLTPGNGVTLVYDGTASRWRADTFVASDVLLPAGAGSGQTPWRLSGVSGMAFIDTAAGGSGTLGVGTFSLGNVTTADAMLYRPAANQVGIKTGTAGIVSAIFGTAASGVNYHLFTPAATGAGPILAAEGSDANIPYNINAKGNSNVIAGVSSGGDGGYFEVNRVGLTSRFLRLTPLAEIISGNDFQLTLKTQSGGGTQPVTFWASRFINRLGTTSSYSGWETVANGVQKPIGSSDGSTPGWSMPGGGACLVGSNQTNATTTPQTAACYVTGTTPIALAASRRYKIECDLFIADSVAADGAVIDFDGGTATATIFRAMSRVYDTALVKAETSTTLANDVDAATVTGDGSIEVRGYINVNAAGTFQPRFFQAAHTTGTLTLYEGSSCVLEDVTQ